MQIRGKSYVLNTVETSKETICFLKSVPYQTEEEEKMAKQKENNALANCHVRK